MLEFYKYHGAGNDFIMINNRKNVFDIKNVEKIKLLCDRHFGIGADGLILLELSDKADCFMNYFNADGTLAEMCGNGIRCLAKFFLEQTKFNLKELSIDTRAGIKKVTYNVCATSDVAQGESFSVNMGAPIFSHQDFPDGPLIFENILFKFVKTFSTVKAELYKVCCFFLAIKLSATSPKSPILFNSLTIFSDETPEALEIILITNCLEIPNSLAS